MYEKTVFTTKTRLIPLMYTGALMASLALIPLARPAHAAPSMVLSNTAAIDSYIQAQMHGPRR
jgi:hypothetical protein